MASSYARQRQPGPPQAGYPDRYRYGQQQQPPAGGGGGGGDVQWIERAPAYPPSYSYYPNSPPRRSNGNGSHRQQPSKQQQQQQQHSGGGGNHHQHQGPVASPSEPPRSYAPLGYPVPGHASPIRSEEYQTSDETDLPVYPYRPPQLPDTLLGPTFIETERLKTGDNSNIDIESRISHDVGLSLSLDAAKLATSGNSRRITVIGDRPVDNSLLNFDLEFRPQLVPPEIKDNLVQSDVSANGGDGVVSATPAQVPLHYNDQQHAGGLRVDTTPKQLHHLSSAGTTNATTGPAAMSPGDPITPGKPTARKRKVFPPPIGDRTSRYDYQYDRPHFGDQQQQQQQQPDQTAVTAQYPSPAPASGESLYSHPPYAAESKIIDGSTTSTSQEKRQRSESDTSATSNIAQQQQQHQVVAASAAAPSSQRFTKRRQTSGSTPKGNNNTTTVASITADAIAQSTSTSTGTGTGYRTRLRQQKDKDNLPPLPPPSYPPPQSGNRRAK